MLERSEHSLVPALGSTPWFVLLHGRYKQIQTFFSPIDGSLHHRSIPEMQEQFSFGCSNGHLMLFDMDSGECCLLNLVTMQVIDLPPLSNHCFHYRPFFLLSTSPNHANCTVVLVKHVDQIIVCRPGDEEWRLLHHIHFQHTNYLESGLVSSNGNLYLHNADNKLIIIDPASLDVQELEVETIQKRRDSVFYSQILVESHEELFLVILYFHFPSDKCLCVEVYKFNESERKWKKVHRIGENRAIFIGNHHTGCMVVDDPRVEGDSVYFVRPSYGMRFYRYSLVESEIILLKLLCPNLRKTWYNKSCYLAMAAP